MVSVYDRVPPLGIEGTAAKRRKGKGGGKKGAPATAKKVAKMTEAEMAAELKAWRTTKNVGLVCKAHAKGKTCNDPNCTRAHPKQK